MNEINKSLHNIQSTSETLLALLVNTVKDYAIFALDENGLILTWNEGARRLKLYEADEIIGKHFSWFYTEEDIARKHPEWELEQAKKHGRYEEEGWRIRKDGSRFWANIVITAIFNKEGKLIAFAKVTRDLTERKKAQDELSLAYQSLEKRVEERTAELKQAKELAERAVRIREDFLAIAGHELKNPLTSLKLKSQLAERRLKNKPENEEFRTFVELTEKQIDKMLRLVDDITDVSRMSQGKLNMTFQACDICHLVSQVVEKHREDFNEKDTPIIFNGHKSIELNVDPMRIEQVITNLLVNALKYAPHKLVIIKTEVKENKFYILVQDHGPGIPAENIGRIFNLYERLEFSKTLNGFGIGLYLSKLIIDAHKGKISCESEVGQGTKFIIELPLPEASDDQD